MRRLICEFAYDGTDFSGYQVQPTGRTVQGELEKALAILHKGQLVRIMASGRTDTGVHAKRQVAHFDSPLPIPEEGWRRALTTKLPADIVILDVRYTVPGFHARFDVVKKAYHYRLLQSAQPDVFRNRYTYYYPFDLQLEPMQAAAQSMLGCHDFTSFCAAQTDVRSKVRNLYTADIDRQQDEIVFRFVGNGFLRQMVRILVGTLLDVGRGQLRPEDFSAILMAKDRRQAGTTAPGCGLTLWDVFY